MSPRGKGKRFRVYYVLNACHDRTYIGRYPSGLFFITPEEDKAHGFTRAAAEKFVKEADDNRKAIGRKPIYHLEEITP